MGTAAAIEYREIVLSVPNMNDGEAEDLVRVILYARAEVVSILMLDRQIIVRCKSDFSSTALCVALEKDGLQARPIDC